MIVKFRVMFGNLRFQLNFILKISTWTFQDFIVIDSLGLIEKYFSMIILGLLVLGPQ